MSVNVDLVQGSNELLITATTADGLANIDLIHFSEGVSDAGCLATSIDDDTNTTLHVYPNPTSGLVSFSHKADWELFDVVGLKLASGNNDSSIDLTDYADGIYVIVVNGQTFITRKE